MAGLRGGCVLARAPARYRGPVTLAPASSSTHSASLETKLGPVHSVLSEAGRAVESDRWSIIRLDRESDGHNALLFSISQHTFHYCPPQAPPLVPSVDDQSDEIEASFAAFLERKGHDEAHHLAVLFH
jgi:hypothetical protein